LGTTSSPDDYTRENWVGIVQPPHLDPEIMRPKELTLYNVVMSQSETDDITIPGHRYSGSRSVDLPQSDERLGREHVGPLATLRKGRKGTRLRLPATAGHCSTTRPEKRSQDTE